MRLLLFLVFVMHMGSQKNFSQNSNRVVTTGVPFLMITADARAAGMGELGVATSADNYSQYWNPAKYAFIESEKGLGLSYTPYLRQLVDDIFLGSLTYFKKTNERSAWISNGFLLRAREPASIFEKSRISLRMCKRCLEDLSMVLTLYSVTAEWGSISINSLIPMMPVNGVLISWLILAKNRDLASFAI